MMFQSYALFPHMSVAQNLAFPLEVRGVSRSEIETRVKRALEMVELPDIGGRRPVQLSGGQQQRIALARALIFEPAIVLMDEPLGALDKHLREQMQYEIKTLHGRLGITMVYVTHDQSEALTMSDRIAVFHHGKVQQLDEPERIYEAPVNAFVARFIGENNRLDGVLESTGSARCTVRLADDTCIDGSLAEALAPGTPVTVSLRPERVQIRLAANTMPGAAGSRLEGALQEVIYLGDHVRLRVALSGNGEFMVKRPISETHALPAVGDVVALAWAPEHCRAFAREMQQS
jgi:putative spermidine/putrescine transport system ATP-binding protein